MNKILLVEDDPGLVFTLKDRLESAGYEVENTDSGTTALKLIHAHSHNLIILDLMIKGKNGMDVCLELRSKGITIPIIMLTARGQTSDKISGLKIGADDYVTKPFDMYELFARIEALLRRDSGTDSYIEKFTFGNIEIDLRLREAIKNGVKIEFPLKEFQLLKFLVLNRNRIIPREEILNEVWGYEENPSTRTIDTHVGWLRQKLEDNPKDPKIIVTVFGTGYKFITE